MEINSEQGILHMCGVTIIGYFNNGVQLWHVTLLYDDFVGQIHRFKFAHLEYITNESITYVRGTNKMHTFFINDLIQLYHLRHVSNNQMFITRKTVQAAVWYLIMHLYKQSSR